MSPLLLAASRRRMRIEFLQDAAGDRFDRLELNFFLFLVSTGSEPDLTMTRQTLGMSDEQIRALPGVLIGSAGQVAETLLRYRERYGLTYFSALEPHMAEFAKVIECLR